MLNPRTIYLPSLPFLCSLISVSLVTLYGCKLESPMITPVPLPAPTSARPAPPMIEPSPSPTPSSSQKKSTSSPKKSTYP